MDANKPIGKTARGLAVYPVTHPSYSHLERTHAVGAEPPHLAKLAQAAHPNYRAVDHEEASVMHHARRNMHAARAHEAASQAMSKALPQDTLPASDSMLAWVYEGASADMCPADAATAIRAATLGWTTDDHLDEAAVQHVMAMALSDDPERQAACAAAAFMHASAAGVVPQGPMVKGLDPKILRPKLGTKPEQIGTTRSGKKIFNMFTHPAHASFTTADHVDHINAMAAHSEGKKMHKAEKGEGSRGGKVIGHTAAGRPIYNTNADVHSGLRRTGTADTDKKFRYQNDNARMVYARHAGHYNAQDHQDAANAHKQRISDISDAKGSSRALNRHQDLVDAHSAIAHAMQRGVLKSYNPSGHSVHTQAEITATISRGITAMQKSEAVIVLERFLSKSSASVLGRTTSGKAVHPASHPSYSKVRPMKTMASGSKKHVGVQDAIRSTLRAHGSYTAKDHAEAGALHEKAGNIHLAEVHNMASGYLGAKGRKMSKAEKGEGSRGGKILRHTAAGIPVYAPASHNGFSIGKTNSGIPVHHDGSHMDLKNRKDYVDASRLHGAKAAFHRQKAAKISEKRQGNSTPSSALSTHERLMNEHERHAQNFAQIAKEGKFPKNMAKSDAAIALQALATLLTDNTDHNGVDPMGGSHDLFMQQAELANCPTMWATIATVPEN